MNLYHVTPKWDGTDLKSASARYGECRAIEMFLAKWKIDDAAFAQDQVTKIYLYRTLAEAVAHRETYGGEILAIDAAWIETEIDPIEGHICTRNAVPARDIVRI